MSLVIDKRASRREGVYFRNFQIDEHWEIVVRDETGDVYCVVWGATEAEARQRAEAVTRGVF